MLRSFAAERRGGIDLDQTRRRAVSGKRVPAFCKVLRKAPRGAGRFIFMVPNQ
jgi:hypothetical protein